MKNNMENSYLSDSQLRQEINKNRETTKVVVLKPIGYPMESNYIETPEIEVTNKELFEIYARDQWSGYKIHKSQYIFDQKLIPDFAFQVVDVRPDNSYIGANTSILVLPSENSEPTPTRNRDIKIDDIIGQEKAKNKTKIITKYVEDPEKFDKWAPKNILFYGRPGTGKTMLAQALANELKIPIMMIKATTLIGDHVGDGAKQIHELYAEAREKKPCVIFIDELDAIALERKYQSLRGDVTEIVNALLTEMDGIADNTGVITICATNTPQILDNAIRSRFEEEINFELPNNDERRDILKKYMDTLPLECSFDIDQLVIKTKGLSGRDLREKILKTALHHAITCDNDVITQSDIDYALNENKKEYETSDEMFG
ncbi:MAG: AAA family ATPase [Methanosphaera sp.]|nr:AAA family ATPase [Methanosphaera sp.]